MTDEDLAARLRAMIDGPPAPPLWHALGLDGALVVCADPVCPHEEGAGWSLVTEGREPRVVDRHGRCA